MATGGHSPSQEWKRHHSFASSVTLSPSSLSSSSSSMSSGERMITATGENCLGRCQLQNFGADLPQLSWSDDITDSPSLSTTSRTDGRNIKARNDEPPQQLTQSTTMHTIGNRNRIRSRPGLLTSTSLSQSSSMIQNVRSSSFTSPSHTNIKASTTTSEDTDYEIKNTIDVLVGSISAAINFCRHSGVPKPSILQLERNLDMKRYFAVMSRLQHYIGCIQSQNVNDLLAKIHLAVTAWEALCRYKALEHKLAYKYVSRLRNANSAATAAVVDLPTFLLSSFSLSSSSALLGGTISEAEIQRAIQMQVKFAEQFTTCRKKLYLVHRWQREMLSRCNRASTTKPEGHQAIPCPPP
eukprot:CAMPEP_0168184294 /NCGR_PEP_ID=MMETSP0139_2-20121125/13139_1 /TAXON_ID=44445 /ORGANISM="Pseudo-nitzschia australis, Strain 10249 10 AB" /LENGTH=352 /DNA_ID=CAMNT_0008105859 /DNA_START=236 /DNA_END=1294 /DNA_ORIENTATION=+